MNDLLNELEALLGKATAGPWRAELNDTAIEADEEMVCICNLASSVARDMANAALIIALRNAAPALIARIRELEKAKDCDCGWAAAKEWEDKAHGLERQLAKQIEDERNFLNYALL